MSSKNGVAVALKAGYISTRKIPTEFETVVTLARAAADFTFCPLSRPEGLYLSRIILDLRAGMAYCGRCWPPTALLCDFQLNQVSSRRRDAGRARA